jgi:ribosomal protein L29
MKTLTGAVAKDTRDATIRALEDRVRELERSLEDERAQNISNNAGAQELRKILAPLYGALQMVFGELNKLESNPDPYDNHKAGVWEDWKRKMPGHPAKFIDALLIHGALTQTQLRIHAQCAAGSVPGVVSKLWQAGLINKNNGKISLKEI